MVLVPVPPDLTTVPSLLNPGPPPYWTMETSAPIPPRRPANWSGSRKYSIVELQVAALQINRPLIV